MFKRLLMLCLAIFAMASLVTPAIAQTETKSHKAVVHIKRYEIKKRQPLHPKTAGGHIDQFSKNVNHEANRESKDFNHSVNKASKDINKSFQKKKKKQD